MRRTRSGGTLWAVSEPAEHPAFERTSPVVTARAPEPDDPIERWEWEGGAVSVDAYSAHRVGGADAREFERPPARAD